MFWAHRTETTKNSKQIDPAVSEKASKKSTVGIPFGIKISTFSKTCKSINVLVKPIHLTCFTILKTIMFRSNVHSCFMFFQSRSREPFLEGPGANLYWKVGCWYHVQFSRFSKSNPLHTIFCQKGSKGWVGIERVSVLAATLLFTKPQELMCRWDLLVF